MKRLLVDLTPVREHREFRLLLAGRTVTFFGSMITYVAIPYQVFHLTNSTWLVGLLGGMEFVALMSTALVGGALADAVDRRVMVRLTEGALLVMSVALALNASLQDPSVVALFVLAGLMTVCDGLQRPSLDALLPRLVPPNQVMSASALQVIGTQVGAIGGPALAGVLIAWAGLPTTYLVDVGTFAVSLLLLQRMRAVPPAADAPRPSLRGVVEGLRYARSRPELLGTYLIDMNAMFFGIPNALFPALAVQYGGPSALGLLFAAPAVGSVLVTLTSGWARHVHRQGQAILWANVGWGLAILGFALSPWLWLALLMLALAGASDMVSGLFRMTIWNTTIPDHLRGRLAGVEMISWSSGPSLGNLEAGAVAALTTPRISAGVGGVLSLVGTGVIALALPAFRRYRTEPEPDLPAAHVGALQDDAHPGA